MANSVWRVDRITCPVGSRGRILDAVRHVHSVLEAQPGCRSDLVLEAETGSGGMTICTIVEWESETAHAAAGRAVRDDHVRTGFDPATIIAECDARMERMLLHRVP